MTVAQGTSARQALLDELALVGRQNSDATVLFHAAVADRLGLHPTDYKTLGILERLGAMSAGEIAQHSGLATASVTSLIDRLERKGLVKRVADSKDRRRVIVEPVRDRVDAARGYFASTRKSLTALFETYTDQELAVIADFLSRNTRRLREETQRLCSTPEGGSEQEHGRG